MSPSPRPGCDNQKYLQTLTKVPWEAKPCPAENRGSNLPHSLGEFQPVFLELSPVVSLLGSLHPSTSEVAWFPKQRSHQSPEDTVDTPLCRGGAFVPRGPLHPAQSLELWRSVLSQLFTWTGQRAGQRALTAPQGFCNRHVSVSQLDQLTFPSLIRRVGSGFRCPGIQSRETPGWASG